MPSVTGTASPPPATPMAIGATPIKTFTRNKTHVAAMEFSPDGTILATGEGDEGGGEIILWNVTDPARPRAVKTLDAGWVGSVAFSPDGKTMAGAAYAHVKLWNVADPARPRALTTLTDHDAEVTAVAFSPDRKTMATASLDGRVIVWDVADPSRPRILRTLVTETAADLAKAVVALAFSPDGRTMATRGWNGMLIMWDMSDRAHPRAARTVPDERSVGQNAGLLAYSPDGTTLATTYVGDVTLWNVTVPADPHPVTTFPAHQNAIYSLVFSRDSKVMVTAGLNRTAILWDLTNPGRPRAVRTLTAKTVGVWAVALSPDDKILTTADDDGVTVWRLARSPTPLPTP